MEPAYRRRHAEARVLEALADTRIVTVEGPRQSGKSTLCAAIAEQRGLPILNLDGDTLRRHANDDPTGFVGGLASGGAFIDEVQRAPGLILALKAAVDADPRPGRFLISGSANLLLDPRVGDSLAGRVERVPLRPFTQAELHSRSVPRWLDTLWDGVAPPAIRGAPVGRQAYAAAIAAGGFPALAERSGRRQRAWVDDYIASLIARDVPDLVDVRRPDVLPTLLQHIAASSGAPVSWRPIAQAISVDEKTVRSYARLLELLYLTVPIPAWSAGVAGRAVRSPRLVVEDGAVFANLIGASAERIATDETVTGRAYESWVAMELQRLLPHTDVHPRMWHWRSHHGDEVDVVLEDRRGRVVAIEIKAGASVGRSDLRGIRKLREALGERFVAGLVVCTAAETQPLGDRVWVLPVQALWHAGDQPENTSR